MIEHYYNELLKVRNGFKHIEKVSTLNNRKCDIKKALKLIIDNNMEHLLTPSLNLYLVTLSIYNGEDNKNFSEELYNQLVSLIDPGKRYITLVSFIRNITSGFNGEGRLHITNDGSFVSTRSLANEFESRLYDKFRSTCYKVGANNPMTLEDYNIMTVMFRIIMGYCLINNKDDYDCLSKKVIDNYKDIIDELMLHGIFKEPNDDSVNYGFRYEYKLEELSIYITNRLENDYQKEIR